MTFTNSVIYAFLGGIIPTIIWLWYWLNQDSKNPEPKKLLFASFVFGMMTVPVAGFLHWFINILILGTADFDLKNLFFNNYYYAIIVLILWSTIEEVLKYVAAHFGGLMHKSNNEPIDPVIYMMTAALGFSALENTLYLYSLISNSNIIGAIIVGNTRFIGATLLHVACSGLIGVFMAFSFYKNAKIQLRYLFTGFVFAITLHTIFNSFIIRQDNFILIGFIMVWVTIVAVILLLEKVKRFYKK